MYMTLPEIRLLSKAVGHHGHSLGARHRRRRVSRTEELTTVLIENRAD